LIQQNIQPGLSRQPAQSKAADQKKEVFSHVVNNEKNFNKNK